MKLFVFAYLVQKEIFDNLSDHEILTLSICSLRLKALISFTQKSRWNGVEISYEVSDSSTSIRSGHHERCERIFSIMKFGELGSTSECTISGMKIKLKMLTYPRQVAAVHNDPLQGSIISDNSHMSEIIKAVHEHLCFLIGTRAKYHLHVKTTGLIHSLPTLKNISSLHIDAPTIESKQIENLSATKGSYSMGLNVKITGKLNENSPLFNAVFLKTTEQNDETSAEIFSHFVGRRLTIAMNKYSTSKIVNFINGWKLNELGRNIEYLRIYPTLETFQQMHTIQEAVEFKQSPEPLSVFNGILNFFTRDYVVREHDGRVAAVLVRWDGVCIKVLDLTENELLNEVDEGGN